MENKAGLRPRVFVALICLLGAITYAPTSAAFAIPSLSWCLRTEWGYRCMYGPVIVPPNQSVELLSGVAAPSEAGYVLSSTARLVDSFGDPIPHDEVHLHHVAWLNPMKHDMTCDGYGPNGEPIFPDYDRFIGRGKEHIRTVAPEGYGYFWSNQVPQPETQSAPYWVLEGELTGMAGNANTYVQYDVGFVPASKESRIDLEPVFLDIRNCWTNPVYTVREGSGRNGQSERYFFYRMPKGGRFVAGGGHMHDGGIKLVVTNMTEGEVVYTSRAKYGHQEDPWHLTAMSSFRSTKGVRVSKGDLLRLTSVYDSTHTWKDVMAIMILMLAPEKGG